MKDMYKVLDDAYPFFAATATTVEVWVDTSKLFRFLQPFKEKERFKYRI